MLAGVVSRTARPAISTSVASLPLAMSGLYAPGRTISRFGRWPDRSCRSRSVIVARACASYGWEHDGLRTLHRRPAADRGRVEGATDAGRVPSTPAVRHGGAVLRRVRRD